MIQKIEKIAKITIAITLVGIFIAWNLPEPAQGYLVNATVSSTMISCTTPATTTAFGTIDNTLVYTASPMASTTMQSSGSIYLKFYGAGNGTNSGLYGTTSTALIESPNSAFATSATLVAGTEGYGLQVASGTAGNLLLHPDFRWASSTADVGGIPRGSASSTVLASSSAAVATAEYVNVLFKTAVSIGTPGDNYSDSITYTCTSS